MSDMGGISDDETFSGLPVEGGPGRKESLYLPYDSVYEELAAERVRGFSWNWDESSPCSSWSSDSCGPSSLSLMVGESARPTTFAMPDIVPLFVHRSPCVSSMSIYPSDLVQGEYDYQGIPWSRFSISRSEYRQKRIKEYSNYNNVNWNAKLEYQRRLEISGRVVCGNFFSFYETYKSINPTIDHFQLRHLLYSTSNVLSYYVSNSILYSFNKQKKVSKKIIEKSQMASACVDHGLAAAGSFNSDVSVAFLARRDGAAHMVIRMSELENSITNHVLITSPSEILVANNDMHLSKIDVSAGRVAFKYKWTSAVNHVSQGPSGLCCLSGDDCVATLWDARAGPTGSLAGHLDYLFCSSWQSSTVVCTGSQDGTCRVWDLRQPRTAVTVLGSVLGAVRSATFSPNGGKFLAFSEPADIVHIYDTSTFKECQVVDFFGNIGGIAFSPDASKLSVAVADTMFGSIVDFQIGTLPINTTKRPNTSSH